MTINREKDIRANNWDIDGGLKNFRELEKQGIETSKLIELLVSQRTNLLDEERPLPEHLARLLIQQEINEEETKYFEPKRNFFIGYGLARVELYCIEPDYTYENTNRPHTRDIRRTNGNKVSKYEIDPKNIVIIGRVTNASRYENQGYDGLVVKICGEPDYAHNLGQIGIATDDRQQTLRATESQKDSSRILTIKRIIEIEQGLEFCDGVMKITYTNE